MINNPWEYLCCPNCHGELSFREDNTHCDECEELYEIRDGIYKFEVSADPELQLSTEKWEKIYEQKLRSESFYADLDSYESVYLNDVLKQLYIPKDHPDNLIYLEIGCGPFFLGKSLSKRAGLVIGIDVCYSALKIAKRILDESGTTNYLLIQGNILKMPIKKNVVGLIYGGGVIEHFEDTQSCLRELSRVLVPKGKSFNTVPMLNLGSLTYRQIWGNIPNLPILKQIAEFLHMRILRGRHMIFGYEMSFTKKKLESLHRKAGFKDVAVSQFDIELSLEFVPNLIRKPFLWLAKNSSLFWPMVKVIAKK